VARNEKEKHDKNRRPITTIGRIEVFMIINRVVNME
jgi:hypothetical protein